LIAVGLVVGLIIDRFERYIDDGPIEIVVSIVTCSWRIADLPGIPRVFARVMVFHRRARTGSRGFESESVERGDCNWPSANGRPISGVLDTAAICTVMGPARKALRPALIAAAKAPAMWTGSVARETAVFNNTASKPHSITWQA
jgi:hypothetical protein